MFIRNFKTLHDGAKYAFRRLFKEEKGAVDLVTIVILIGIAVLLALVFKTQIQNLLETLFGTINTNAVNAVNGTNEQ